MIVRIGEFGPMTEVVRAGYRRNLLERFKPALEQQPGFIAGYWLEHDDGRELSVTVWESDDALASGAQIANATPLLDGLDPSLIPTPTNVATFKVIAASP